FSARRVPDRGEVNPDLMGAACFESDPEQSGARERPLDLDMSPCLPGAVRPDRVAGPVAAVAADRSVDGAGAGIRAPVDEGEVLAADLAFLQLSLERRVDLVGFSDEHQPGGVAV